MTDTEYNGPYESATPRSSVNVSLSVALLLQIHGICPHSPPPKESGSTNQVLELFGVM